MAKTQSQRLSLKWFLKLLCRKNVMLALDPIVHESYKSPKSNSNDIALLKLAEDVNLTT